MVKCSEWTSKHIEKNVYFAAVVIQAFQGPGDLRVHNGLLRALGFAREEFKYEPA